MPKLSVISIAKKEESLKNLRKALENQTFQDFEIVTSTKGTIPEAWNDAVSKAKGEFFVFTESDAIPANCHWLEEIAEFAKRNEVIKGLEVNPTDLCLCNTVFDSEILKSAMFDESFKCAEDTELFARLRKSGVRIKYINAFPVIHSPTKTWRKTFSRGIQLGMYFMKIIYMHGKSNIDTENTMGFRGNYIHPISNRFRIITENLLVLLGLVIGAIWYLPIKLKDKITNRS